MPLEKTKYFRLRPECHLVLGAERGAIYNLLTGDVFSLGDVETKIMISCERNGPLDCSAADCNSSQYEMEFLDRLEKNNIGMFLDEPAYIEKYHDRLILSKELFHRNPPVIQILFLELTNKCNLSCKFCKDVLVKRRWGCIGCKKWPSKERQLSLKSLRDILCQASKLDCRNLIIGGGNPVVETGRLSYVFNHAKALGFVNVYLISNAANISDEVSKLLDDYRIQLIIQVFSNLEEEHDSIVGIQGSFSQVVNNLNTARNKGTPFYINVLVTEGPPERIEEAVEYFKSFSPINVTVDFIYTNASTSLSPNLNDTSRARMLQREGFLRPGITDFFNNKEKNPCLNGKLAVTSSGTFLPCPSMRNDILGSLQNMTIDRLFSDGELGKYWDLSKDKLKGCKVCEFRYACHDCRALQKDATDDLYGMKYCRNKGIVGG